MKKGLFFTLRFKHLFNSLLLVLLVVSFALFSVVIKTENQNIKVPVNVSSTQTESSESSVTIIIDAGHGGEDGGTSSSKGVLEKDINLAIALKLNSLMKLMGYKTLMIRETDSMIYSDPSASQREKKISDIQNRMKIINNTPDGIFLSIHQNYFTQSKYSGTQVFYSGGHNDSKVLAGHIQNSVVRNIQKNNQRKIKQSGKEIYLLYHSKMPAVMVECGFMSNPGEALLLSDEDYQMKMSLAIIDGVTQYIENKGES